MKFLAGPFSSSNVLSGLDLFALVAFLARLILEEFVKLFFQFPLHLLPLQLIRG